MSGAKLRERGAEIVVDPCPVSGCKGDKFAINADTGAWNCPKCGEKGNSWQLVERTDSGPVTSVRSATPREAPIPQSEVNRTLADFRDPRDAHTSWLESRGITIDTARAWHLRYRPDSIGFVYRHSSGHAAFVKWRAMTGSAKGMWRWPAKARMEIQSTPLYGTFDETEPVIVCEGEMDALTLWQCGLRNVVSVANGAGAWDDAWSAALVNVPQIICAYDDDDAGNGGAESMRSRFGSERVARLTFEGHKDANEALIAGWDAARFHQAVAEARVAPSPILRNARDAALDLVEHDNESGGVFSVMTGHTRFDTQQHGLRMGEMSVVTAHTGEGKTTWLMDLCIRLAEREEPACFFTLEQGLDHTLRQVMMMHRRFDYQNARHEDRIAAARSLPGHLFLGTEPGSDQVKQVAGAIRYARVIHNVRVFVVDHLDFLIETKAHESRYVAATEAVRAIHRACIDNDVHVFLVVQQISDSGRTKQAERPRARLESMAETRSSRQLANNGFVVSSNKTTNKMTLHVDKARYGPAMEGDFAAIMFQFDGYRFEECDEF